MAGHDWKLIGIRPLRDGRDNKPVGQELLVARPSGTIVAIPLDHAALLSLISEAADALRRA